MRHALLLCALAGVTAAPAAASFGHIAHYLFPRGGPDDHTWHLKKIRVDIVRQERNAFGAGILIAQLDTGWIPHPAIPASALDLQHEHDFANDMTSALDDMMPRDGLLSVPAHCTHSQALMVGSKLGVAPAARVLPIKVSHGVVTLDPKVLAVAIDHAAWAGADVILIAQGTSGYDAELHAAVRRATDAGIIVVAAAGNVTPFVLFPAAFDEVIAVAATTPDDEGFLFTSFGAEVDIAAPGAQVYTAWVTRNLFTGRAERAERVTFGTTASSALIAGVAALWLGDDLTRRERLGPKTTAVFRDLLIKTARRPPHWKPERFGAGVVDAAALLMAPDS